MEPVTITASDKEVTYAASSVKTAPTAKTLTYNGQLQQLIKAGEADGGEMKYAVTKMDVEGLIAQNIEPIRPGRSFARQHRFKLPISFCYRN